MVAGERVIVEDLHGSSHGIRFEVYVLTPTTVSALWWRRVTHSGGNIT